MTALAGDWNFSGRDSAADCARMLQAQSIYGNRAASTWCESGVCLGRKMFELLPEDRLDPGVLVAPERKRVLIADVRLDNRGELADALGLAGRQAQMSDSALLMAALDRWDEDAIARLVGDFAFVL